MSLGLQAQLAAVLHEPGTHHQRRPAPAGAQHCQKATQHHEGLPWLPLQQKLGAREQHTRTASSSSPPPIKPNLVSHPLEPLGEVTAHKVLAVVQVGGTGPGVTTAAVPPAPKLLVIPHDGSGVPVHAPCSTPSPASAARL